MKYEVVGVQIVDFKPKDGNQITGTKLHCLTDPQQTKDFEGRKVETLFLSQYKFSSVKVHPGDCIDVGFNRYGKVEFFDILKTG